jgi:transposase
MEKYDNYIAVDWAQKNMSVATLSKNMENPRVVDVPASVKELKVYLQTLKGSKILTIEESSTSQWLYTELVEHVKELIVCNPYRNRLLQHGPKNDKIDAAKLVTLLHNNLLSPVYHDGSDYFQLRKLASGYRSIIRNGVRLKNQRSALFVACGKNKKEKILENNHEIFVLKSLDTLIQANEEQVNIYVTEFKKLKKSNKVIKNLVSIPGIQEKNAVKLLAIVIDPKRFSDKGHWLSYCGLIRHEKMSGGRSYGFRKPQYSRDAKSIFKTAAQSCISKGNKENVFHRYYQKLRSRGIAEHNARHAVARRIAILTLGVLKSGHGFENRWKEKNIEEKQ